MNTKQMTIFSRYYIDGKLIEKSMKDVEKLIEDDKYRIDIADLIYHRYYERFLKIFFFEEALGNERLLEKKFKLEYKHGFSIMVNCCLLIETLASFIEGNNETQKVKSGGVEAYKRVFTKAKDYGNELSDFIDKPIYGAIRCGLMHQGETYNGFIIKRDGELINGKIINATKFCKCLKQFLKSYCEELKNTSTRWDGELWDNCRIKIRYIIRNSSK